MTNLFATSDPQRSDRANSPTNRSRKWGEIAGLLAILIAPSVWMLVRIPPLWKDIDAYAQVTAPAGIATILHYTPLYCFAARIPLFFGYAFDCWRSGAVFPALDFFQHPILCDSGVFGLLLCQHAALCSASLWIILLASGSTLLRFSLALLWASNPLFYTFAHCVGSESGSLVLILLLSAAGLRLIPRETKYRKRDWALFGALLICSSLTRHVNLVLAALLPTAFLVFIAARLTVGLTSKNFPRRELTNDIRRFALAVGVCLVCLALSALTLRLLSRAAEIPYQSRLGFTFMWRLRFLDPLSLETRNAVLDRVSRKTSDPDVQTVLAALREEFPSKGDWDILAFLDKLRAAFHSDGSDQAETDLGRILSRTARAFWFPPEPALLVAVKEDFRSSWSMRIPEVVRHLFNSTSFYFLHPETMPSCERLTTYRNRTALDVRADLRHNRFFRLWKSCSYRTLFFVWLAMLLTVAFLRKREIALRAPILSYAIALTVTGLLVMLANCFCTEFAPRYTMPMWTLLLVSATILGGQLGDLIPRVKSSPC